jgi:tripartite-type tricarboxylate transporter receptor subunit TctC
MNLSAPVFAVALALVAGTCIGMSPAAYAQPYPSKPVRFVVSASPGGAMDTLSRIVGNTLSERLGQPVVVENRPGAGGALGGETVARAVPDGYALNVNSIAHAVLPSANRKLSFSPERDLATISVMAIGPNVLVVHPSLPARNVKELVAIARARPGDLLYSSSGIGGNPHMAMEVFKLLAKIDIVHVPYKGAAPGMIDLIGGRVAMTFSSVVSARQEVATGRLRMLASAGAKRSVIVPDLPTMAEAGVPGYAVDIWYALFAPAGTPKEVLLRLNAEVVRSVQVPAVAARLLEQGLEPVGDTLERSDAYIRAETVRWAKVVKAAGIAMD